jgi:hypothetical protein
MRKGLLIALAVVLTGVSPAAASTGFGDPVRVAAGSADANLYDVIADEAHLPAFVAGSAVVRQDSSGRWRRFTIAGAERRLLVPIEDGKTMVVWDEGSAIRTRVWDRTGDLGPVQTVLTGIGPTIHGPPGIGLFQQWQLVANRFGAVVIAGFVEPGPQAGAVVAAIRDPGSPFGPQLQVHPADASVAPPNLSRIGESPLTDEGTVTVWWAPTWSPQSRGAGMATRVAGSATFNAPLENTPYPGVAPGTLITSDSRTVTPAEDLATLCSRSGGCVSPRLFEWRNAPARVAVLTGGGWWLATQRPDGRFGDPRRVIRNGVLAASATPGIVDVWTAVPANPAGRGGGVFRTPFGVRPRRAPVTSISGAPASSPGTLSLPVGCEGPCRLSATLRQFGGSRLTHARETAACRTTEPLESCSLSFHRLRANTRKVQVKVTARGENGRTTRTTVVLRSRTGSRDWIVAASTESHRG